MKIDKDYMVVRDWAQAQADETGFDYGIEYNASFFEFRAWMLPGRKFRSGHELRCEVVSCTTLSKCRSGHGPEAI
jgi:hypothetical protein